LDAKKREGERQVAMGEASGNDGCLQLIKYQLASQKREVRGQWQQWPLVTVPKEERRWFEIYQLSFGLTGQKKNRGGDKRPNAMVATSNVLGKKEKVRGKWQLLEINCPRG